MIARIKGYPLTCVNARERDRGAEAAALLSTAREIVSSPAAEGSNGAVRIALQLAESDPRWFVPFQYANPANVRAHYEGTGAEIVDGALIRVDILVAGPRHRRDADGRGRRVRDQPPRRGVRGRADARR